MRRGPRQGFSLIEALVALAIAAVVLATIFELQIQMVRSQQRAEAALRHVVAQENALALLRHLNPMAEPEGEIRLEGGDAVRWRSEARTRAIRNTGLPIGDGEYEVQLYTVTVEIEQAGDNPPAPLIFDRVGWRRLYEFSD